MRALHVLLLLTSLAACAGGGGSPSEAGGGADIDGGQADGGTDRDASAPIDGGTDRDAGASVDGGSAPDGGTRVDGGTDLDGGTTNDGGTTSDGGTAVDGGEQVDAGPIDATPIATCLGAQFERPDAASLPDYDRFDVTVGSHCVGTNQQDITGIERVVFLGDAITVGTPPTESASTYRSRLAEQLVDRFGLSAPSALWQNVNPIEGTAVIQDSGDFSSCATWGAVTDDLVHGDQQIGDCFPMSTRSARTLVVVTVGLGDLSAIIRGGLSGQPISVLYDDAQQSVQRLRDALEWIFALGRFPNGVFVVFANVYDYTDASAELGSCPDAAAAGFDGEWSEPDTLLEIVRFMNEEYMSIARDTGADLLFLHERFCGHGFEARDPTSPCYRGPDQDTWFDATCVHPTPDGHRALADMFMAIIDE